MPLYEYECRGCGNRFELLVLATTARVCPSCNSADLERLVSLFSPSSEGTREIALKAGRQQGARIKKEKDAAHLAYLKEHDH